jgi:hypothetical protein
MHGRGGRVSACLGGRRIYALQHLQLGEARLATADAQPGHSLGRESLGHDMLHDLLESE